MVFHAEKEEYVWHIAGWYVSVCVVEVEVEGRASSVGAGSSVVNLNSSLRTKHWQPNVHLR